MELKYTRAQYMNQEVSHHDYYSQFCSDYLISMVVDAIGGDKIKASIDPHMNDIPLANWDRLEPNIRTLVGGLIRKAEGQCSLSDCVCTAKAAARLWLADQNIA